MCLLFTLCGNVTRALSSVKPIKIRAKSLALAHKNYMQKQEKAGCQDIDGETPLMCALIEMTIKYGLTLFLIGNQSKNGMRSKPSAVLVFICHAEHITSVCVFCEPPAEPHIVAQYTSMFCTQSDSIVAWCGIRRALTSYEFSDYSRAESNLSK